jgi:lipid A 3-O-deacylase
MWLGAGTSLLTWAVVCVLWVCAGNAQDRRAHAENLQTDGVTPRSRSSSIWPDGMGNGLRTSVNEVALAAGPAIGTRKFAGWQVHHLVLGRIDYARLRTGVIGHSPLRGSIEGRLELWGGGQYHPEDAYLLGFTPTLRYNLATGTRWMPFVDMGAGLALTDIGRPDLGTTFEFNLQAGGGCSYFLQDDLALTLQYRFVHISNGDMDQPNVGVNTNAIYIGLSRYF